MSIDPSRLRDACQLVFGMALDSRENGALARTLGVVEEVLPWMALHRGAFTTFPEIEAAIKVAAAICPSAASRRPLPHEHPSQTTLDTNRALEKALGAVIAENIKNSSLAVTADHYLAELVRVTSSSDCFDGQLRVAIDRWTP